MAATHLRRVCTAAAAVVALGGCAALSAGELRAGAAAVNITPRIGTTLAAAQAECAIAARRPTAEETAKAREVAGGRSVSELHSWQEDYARETLILAEYTETVALPLQVLRIGGVAIAGWPGETFAASGLALKERSPLKPLFDIELANGWYGYIPPPEQFALGAYETRWARTSFLETRATEKMLDAFVALLGGSR